MITPDPTPQNQSAEPASIWRQTATSAVGLTLLATCAIAIDVRNPIEAIGNLLFSVPVTFLFWWLVCTFIVWLWRAIFPVR